MNDETEVLVERDGVPTRLETPVTCTPEILPTVTRLQVLPLRTLQWDNFERLCLRYARSHGAVVRSQLYGVKGQAQHGIDLYVRLADPPRYEAYQCKKIEALTPSVISKAVEKFLKGTWRSRVTAFRIMTSHPIEDAKIAEAIESAAKTLEAESITFEVMGEVQISDWLKDKPRLVDEFLSRAWIEPFCGADALKEIGQRLSADDVARYRRELKKFYETIFTRHDPGIPVKAQLGEREFPFRERFVIPDIYGSIGNDLAKRSAQSVSSDTELSGEAQSENRNRLVSAPTALQTIRTRSGLDRWLSQSQRSVILGGPGSGKSTLLRVMAIELLSEEPLFEEAAVRWGSLLPIWIPFSFWTTLNAKRTSSVPFTECLRTWFAQFDQKEIWTLVESALEDDRLLLLVDSLDEWTDETAARTTSDLLHTYIQLHNLPAVLVSRPHGFDRVSQQGLEWQRGELAPLSIPQQTEIVAKWLDIHRRRSDSASAAMESHVSGEETTREAADFIKKLAKSKDLAQLAEVPLTLLLLLLLHLQNSPLPANRFEAYEYVTQHFIREHPLSRRVAATLTAGQELVDPMDIRNVLAYLAYSVQTNFPAGIVSIEEIRQNLEAFLRDETGLGLGLSRAESRDFLRSFTNVEEGSLGLLVSQGQEHVSFFHRSLQEYLASVHLSRMSLSIQQSTIAERIDDSRWREIILGAIFLCRRSEDADALAQALEGARCDPLANLKRDDVLAEVAFKDTNLSQAYSKKLIAKAFQEIEMSPIASQRSRLLFHAMSGLRARKSKTLVRDRIERWTFSRGIWGPGRIAGMRSWPDTDDTWQVLHRLFFDEDPTVMRSAADAAAHIFGRQEKYGDIVAQIAIRSDSPYQRAAGLECLAKGWPYHPSLSAAIADGLASVANELKIASLAARVRLGRQDATDLNALIAFTWDRHSSAIEYSWRSEAGDALVQGFSQDERLKEVCLKSTGRHMSQPHLMDGDTALSVLIRAFPQDNDVAALISVQLKQDHPFLGGGDSMWKIIFSNFVGHPVVIAALDEWVAKQEHPDVIALHYGSQVGRTPVMKEKLFTALNQWVPFWAAEALLKGWGMNDPEVAEKLRERAQKEDAAEIAHLIPQIFPEPNATQERLTSVLQGKKVHRIDTIIQGFAKLPPMANESEIVTLLLPKINNGTSWRGEQALSSLILAFPSDPRVRQLAVDSLDKSDPPFAAIEEAYCNDEYFRARVGNLTTPLSAPLRYQIVSDLAAFADESFTKDVLRHWDAERNAEIKTQASLQFHSLLSATDPDRDSFVEMLDQSLPCYGPDHEARRQAITVGLIVLRQLERVVGKLETIGHVGVQVNIPVTESARQNRVFLNTLGKHWSYVKQALADKLDILDSRIGSRDVWEPLAAVAGDFPELARDVFKETETHASLQNSANYLRLISRTEPGSDNLADVCLTVIADRTNRHDWFDAVEAAATILSEQFRGDSKIEERLISLVLPHHVPTPVSMALSLGWPQNAAMSGWQFEVQSHALEAGELYPKYALIAPSAVPPSVEADIALARQNPFLADNIIRPLSVRLRNDPQVGMQLMHALSLATNPSLKISLARLLISTRGITVEMDMWCRQELLRQETLVAPEFGYDLLAKSIRSVRLSLFEALDGFSGTNVWPEA